MSENDKARIIDCDPTPMDTAHLMEVIETTTKRRGDGIDDPIRIITQYWSPCGRFLAEHDPCHPCLPYG